MIETDGDRPLNDPADEQSDRTANPGEEVVNPYRVLGVVATSHSATHAQSAFLPLIYPFVMAQFGLTYGDIGLMTGVGSAVGKAMQGVYGFAVRRFFRRTIFAAGNLMLGISVLLMGVAGSFPAFFAFSLLAQLSRSPQHPIGASLIADAFGQKLRGTALALDVAGGNLGTVLVPLIGVLAIGAFGWRQSLMGLALLPVLAGVLCLALLPRGGEGVAGQGRRGWVRPSLDQGVVGPSARQEYALHSAGRDCRSRWAGHRGDDGLLPLVSASVSPL